MKVLYINALYDPYIAGGAELSLKLIVESMQAQGHEVAVLSMVPEGSLRSEKVDGVTVYRAGIENIYWPFTRERPRRLRRLLWHLHDRYNRAMQAHVGEVIRLEKPTVVSCHNLVGWSIAAWDAVRRAGIPIVQVLHDMYLLSPNSTLFKPGYAHPHRDWLSRLLRIGHRRASKRLAAVVGVSHSILDGFVKHGYFAGVPQYVVHNARDIANPGPPPVRVAGGALTVGYIGTLSVAKGVEWLIRQFRASRIDGRLLLAGRGKAADLARFEALAGGDERIRFVGYVEPTEFYRAIDALVVPSLWEEPLGMVAVEGLAHHLPVIASNRGGLRETVTDGRNGIRCDPDEPESLGRALVRLWRDAALYNRLAAGARPSVGEYLSVARMVNEYENVLRTAITNHAGS